METDPFGTEKKYPSAVMVDEVNATGGSPVCGAN